MPWALSIGLIYAANIGNGDVSILLKNSLSGRKTINNQSNFITQVNNSKRGHAPGRVPATRHTFCNSSTPKRVQSERTAKMDYRVSLY
jgi:hypothetical protein